ncbi:hypothetical protein MA5S0304_5403 [Mycobacteroides abscessus 5S-0304]|nr:hypothetical protein MA5S0304_5403 [Mycobacteroides abscessus 5S-0304]
MLIHAVAPNRRSLTRMGDSLPQGSLDVELDGPGIPLTAHQCSGSGS